MINDNTIKNFLKEISKEKVKLFFAKELFEENKIVLRDDIFCYYLAEITRKILDEKEEIKENAIKIIKSDDDGLAEHCSYILGVSTEQFQESVFKSFKEWYKND